MNHSTMRKERCFIILAFMLGIATTESSNECTTPNQEDGLCIFIHRCEKLLRLVNESHLEPSYGDFLRKSFCGSENKTVKVCCPLENEVLPTTPRLVENVPTMQPPHLNTIAKCKIMFNITRVRFIGSQEAPPGAWPWMAALGYQLKSPRYRENPILWKCGGTLISSRHVLTAAHCVYNLQDSKLTTVALGDIDLNLVDNADNGITVSVEKFIMHALYNERQPNANDIALVKLISNVTFNQFIQPICLPDATMKTTDMSISLLHIAGWGFTGPQSQRYKDYTFLTEVQVPIVSTKECKTAYSSNKKIFDYDKTLCAGYPYLGSDSCRGDIGGPLTWSIGNQTFLMGILSYTDCRYEPRTPDVYTKVSSFVDWVDEKKKL